MLLKKKKKSLGCNYLGIDDFQKVNCFHLQKKATYVDYPGQKKRPWFCNRQVCRVLHWSLENMQQIHITLGTVIDGVNLSRWRGINALSRQNKRKLAKSSKWGEKNVSEQGWVLNENKPDKLQWRKRPNFCSQRIYILIYKVKITQFASK